MITNESAAPSMPTARKRGAMSSITSRCFTTRKRRHDYADGISSVQFGTAFAVFCALILS